jgi:hypothetical protein
MMARGLWLAAFLLLSLGTADISANKGREDVIGQTTASSSRVVDDRRLPSSECTEPRDEYACRAINGCSWCIESAEAAKNRRRDAPDSKAGLKRENDQLAGSAGGLHCVKWEDCVAPDDLCELRNATSCQVGEPKDKYPCRWCESESRCVQAAENHKDGSGQCRGCDGVFDSGVRIDACGICGGSVSTIISAKNAMQACCFLNGQLLTQTCSCETVYVLDAARSGWRVIGPGRKHID